MSDQITDDDFASVTVDDLKALRRQRDSERDARIASDQARLRAERERDEARGAAGSEAVARFNAEEQAVEAAINSANAEADALTERIAQLTAEGSFSEAAKAHRALARSEAQIAQLTMRKEYLANVKAQPPPPQQHQDPYAGFTAKQRAWAEAHPMYLDTSTSEARRYTSRVNAAHHMAVADNIPVDSEEYFERLSEAAGEAEDTGSHRRDRDRDSDEAPARAAAMPVTRRGVDGGNGRDAPVRLSPEMREAADVSYPDVPVDDHVVNGVTVPGRYKQYAFHQARLKAAGRM